MLIYFVIYFIMVIAAMFCGQYDTKLSKKRFIIFSLSIMALLAGVRSSNVGVDTINYVTMFKYLINNPVSAAQIRFQSIETGYLYFTKLITFFTHSPQIFLLVQSVIICASIGRFFYRHCDNVYLATMFFYSLIYVSTMNVMRQFLALSILFFALDFLQDKKYIKMIIAVFVAAFIHRSAIVFAFVLLAYAFKDKKWFIPVFGIGGIVICYLLNSSYLSGVLSMIGYSRLINSRYMQGSDTSGMLAYVFIVICFIGVVTSFLLHINAKKAADNPAQKKEHLIFFDYYLIMSIIGTYINYLARYNELLSRLGTYFLLFIAVLFPDIIDSLDTLFERRWFKKCSTIVVYALLFVACYSNARGYIYEFLIN